MKLMELDASKFKSSKELYEAIFVVIGAPHWHGHGVDALVDSTIYGGINKTQPPFKILIRNLSSAPQVVRDQAVLIGKHLSFPQRAENVPLGECEVGFELLD